MICRLSYKDARALKAIITGYTKNYVEVQKKPIVPIIVPAPPSKRSWVCILYTVYLIENYFQLSTLQNSLFILSTQTYGFFMIFSPIQFHCCVYQFLVSYKILFFFTKIFGIFRCEPGEGWRTNQSVFPHLYGLFQSEDFRLGTSNWGMANSAFSVEFKRSEANDRVGSWNEEHAKHQYNWATHSTINSMERKTSGDSCFVRTRWLQKSMYSLKQRSFTLCDEERYWMWSSFYNCSWRCIIC